MITTNNKFNSLFNQILSEAKEPFDASKIEQFKAENKQVTIIPARLQPMHIGHKSLIESAKYPVVILIVEGEKTSLDKDKNPLSFEDRKKVIEAAKLEKIVGILKINMASIPLMIDICRKSGFEPKELICGLDRQIGYKAQIDKYASQLSANIEVTVLERDEESEDVSGISATKVREAIRSNNYKAASKMMFNLTPELFNFLKEKLA